MSPRKAREAFMSGVIPRCLRAHFPGEPVRVGNPLFCTQREKTWRRHSAGTIAAQLPQFHTPYRAIMFDQLHGNARRNARMACRRHFSGPHHGRFGQSAPTPNLRSYKRLPALLSVSGKLQLPTAVRGSATICSQCRPAARTIVAHVG